MKKIKYLSLLWKPQKINIRNPKNCYPYNLAPNFFHSNKNNIDSNNFKGNFLSNKNKVKPFKCPKCNNNFSSDPVFFNWGGGKAFFNIAIFRNFNIFELFNIEVNYDIDKSHLKKKFNEIQNIYHPDKNAQNVEISEDECMDDDEFLSEIIKINVEISKPDANIELLTKEYKQKYEDYSKEIKLHFKEKNFNNILNVLKKLKFINRVLERLQNI
ncbi:chaperone [Plasmodium falciparum RAJ116]|uniref:Chaperone n=1 Tax=Plasmodium falciparum RAJ116 TaxID=580058 RepID=A0A0L0CWW5_PLAFA|nr:chaperone [Plasmodium falciparum RAJ116]